VVVLAGAFSNYLQNNKNLSLAPLPVNEKINPYVVFEESLREL
jgi:hypothetical protein